MTQDSDIDMAIVLDGDVAAGKEINRLIDVITEINLNYGVSLSVYPVSERDYNSVNSPLLLNMRRKGVSVESIDYFLTFGIPALTCACRDVSQTRRAAR